MELLSFLLRKTQRRKYFCCENAARERKIMKNIDKIKGMDVDELVEFMWQWYGDDDSMWFYYPEKFGKGKRKFNSEDEIREWLEKDIE